MNVGKIVDDETGKDIPLNQYFVDNPSMILGKMALTGTMYRDDSPTCVEIPGADIKEGLSRAMAQLPAAVYSKANTVVEIKKSNIDFTHSKIKVGAFFIADGRVARRLPDLLDHGDYEFVDHKNEKQGERIKGMIDIRAALRELMAAERAGYESDDAIDSMRGRLNKSYDSFNKKHGYISALPNKQAMSDDPDYPLLHSLERDYDRGISKEIAKRDGVEAREPSAKKADIFLKEGDRGIARDHVCRLGQGRHDGVAQ
ncbi:hypothetical protein ACFS07_36210 [Undibacterium arcticum]